MKRFQSIGVLLSAITGLLVVLLVSVFTYSAKQAYDRRETAVSLLKTVDVLNDVFAAQEVLRFEQGEMSTALAQSGPADAATRARSKISTGPPKPRCAKRIKVQAWKRTARLPICQKSPVHGPIYEKYHADALASLGRPVTARPANIESDWSEQRERHGGRDQYAYPRSVHVYRRCQRIQQRDDQDHPHGLVDARNPGPRPPPHRRSDYQQPEIDVRATAAVRRTGRQSQLSLGGSGQRQDRPSDLSRGIEERGGQGGQGLFRSGPHHAPQDPAMPWRPAGLRRSRSRRGSPIPPRASRP